MNDTFTNSQEWITVFIYLSFMVFIIWRVFTAQKN